MCCFIYGSFLLAFYNQLFFLISRQLGGDSTVSEMINRILWDIIHPLAPKIQLIIIYLDYCSIFTLNHLANTSIQIDFQVRRKASEIPKEPRETIRMRMCEYLPFNDCLMKFCLFLCYLLCLSCAVGNQDDRTWVVLVRRSYWGCLSKLLLMLLMMPFDVLMQLNQTDYVFVLFWCNNEVLH